MKPNILIVVIDSMRADHLSCYGYPRATTPNIDRLAAEGCRFENAITAAPFSPASYASIFSNLYPHQHGVNGDTVRVWPDTWPRLPRLLREREYSTFCVSNNSFVCRGTNAHHGFDRFFDNIGTSWLGRQRERVYRRLRRHFGDHLAKRLSSNHMHCMGKGDSLQSVALTLDWIERSPRPFFGFVILMDPHTPYSRGRTQFSGNTPPVRRFFRRSNDRTMWARQMARRESLSQVDLRVVQDLYDAEIRHADEAVGVLAQTLRRRNQLDETVLAIAADHGEAFGEHGVWGHGFCLNDCLARVPLILRHPRYWRPGLKCPALVQLHDLHDLCLSVAATGEPDVKAHPNDLTQSDDPEWNGRDFAVTEFPRQSRTLHFMRQCNPSLDPGSWDHGAWAVRTRDWRYIEYDDATRELYDLRNDPAETTTVHQRAPDVCTELADKLRLHRSEPITPAGMEPPADALADAVSERLRALGYIE